MLKCFSQSQNIFGAAQNNLGLTLRVGVCFTHCYQQHLIHGKTNVYLNNHLIGSTPLKTEKIIEFNFVDGNVLKIQEDNVAILEFISFEVLHCAINPGIQLF